MKDMADMDGPIWCYSVALKKRPIMNWLEMLNEVLRYHKPDTWDSVSYGQQRYRKVQVFGEEYDKIAGKFTPELRTHVQMIYRVQNPYLYGRYKLKVEQLQLKGQVYEETYYHPIYEDDMNVVMEYNCDFRRYTHASNVQHDGKRPRFYKSAEMAERNFTSSNKALVVFMFCSVF
ncbi:uncharacterized protein LOC110839909 isoform X2 [Zootermopsis nevadensis]|uniref:uncharacterized protein LOC110839909 isoform X2 n=1 Tax=Zootermopsis nevadensis TaxID=136037 RepID=UPI000B8EA7CC|nr:uncharacterized protein LOC110839909 isoform X2 [Zootermopsis nevadensis]